MRNGFEKVFMGAAGSAGGGGLDVDDVFSIHTHPGTGSNQTITNGIDLDGEGGLVWIKNRQNDNSHTLFDSERGNNPFEKRLNTNTNSAEHFDSGGHYLVPSSTGFATRGNDAAINGSGYTAGAYVSWTWRKAPKFFDVVTYSGNGTAGRTVSHNLGSVPGMIIVKRTNSGADWTVYHRGVASDAETDAVFLNTKSAAGDHPSYWNDTAPTDTVFSVGNGSEVNSGSGTYVAYIFAHNNNDGEFGPDSDQDIIKCGNYAGNSQGSNNDGLGLEIDLGFEPQFIMIRNTGWSNGQFIMYDSMRGIVTGTSGDGLLYPAQTYAESLDTQLKVTPTGFKMESDSYDINNNFNYIYMAIRRGSLAPPEAATDVFTPIAAGSDAALFNAPHIVDFGVIFRPGATFWQWTTRLLGNKKLRSSATDILSASSLPDNLFGRLTKGLATSGASDYVGLCWKRAPKFFDCVAYSGTGSNRTISHNLGVVPEMIWIKCTTSTTAWACYSAPVGNTHYQVLNTEALPVDNATYWNDTTPTDEVFSLGNASPVNAGNTGREFIAHLFASLDGVSKIGSYTGNGSNQNIDCGFSNGARFVMVKRISGAAGPWWNWNTVSGLVAGNDNGMQFNADPQYNDVDSIDPYSGGFNIVQNGNVNANVSGASYLFYAVA